MSASVDFIFETTSSGGYVPILGNCTLGPTRIASQDAGSSNPGIFYQVGGGGLNGAFASQLGTAGQLSTVNRSLVTAFDSRYGSGAWQEWNRGQGSGEPPLTSFLAALTPGVPPIGSGVSGLMYSVGPVFGPEGLTDPDAYAAIYADAMTAIAGAASSTNDAARPIDGLRITMLSTGIYAARVIDERALYAGIAGSILAGIVAAVAEDPSLDRVAILINTDDQKPVEGSEGKERYGFGRAAEDLGIPVSKAGFRVPIR